MRHFELNTEGRDFFVGDIHGMYDLFMEKLDAVNFDPDTDRVFSVGDLIDRGPDSAKCLELIFEPWFHAVRGNHEELMRGSHGYAIWMANGGTWINDTKPSFFEHMSKAIKELMPFHQTVETNIGTVGMVHAESEDDWEHNSPLSTDLNVWARSRWMSKDTSFVKNINYVVVGHTPVTGVQRLGNVFYIDTGAVFGDPDDDLTLATIEELTR